MVTTGVAGSDSTLAVFLERCGEFTWDLDNPERRPAFFLYTKALLAGDSGLLEVAELGPPRHLTVEARKAYDALNITLFQKLLPLLDLKQRLPLASYIDEKFGKTHDGHGLWQYILHAADFSQGERQEKMKKIYEEYQIAMENPTPEQLNDGLIELASFWICINGNSWVAPRSLIRKAITILPAGHGFESFSKTVRAMISFNSGNTGFNSYDAFVDIIVEQYRGVLAEAREAEVRQAALPTLMEAPSPATPPKYNPARDAPNDCNLCNSVWCTSVQEDSPAGCISFNCMLETPSDASVNELNFIESGRAHIFETGSTSLKGVKFKVMNYEKAREIYAEARDIAEYIAEHSDDNNVRDDNTVAAFFSRISYDHN
jgi:hypothetical protein